VGPDEFPSSGFLDVGEVGELGKGGEGVKGVEGGELLRSWVEQQLR
jgi:hypothetical protein